MEAAGGNRDTQCWSAAAGNEPPLAGVRVLDLSHHVAGPYCTRLLADHGASVLKIERPGGDPARRLPPLLLDSPSESLSLLYLYLNLGKRTLTLDLRSPADYEYCLTLIRQADVIVENFRPGVLNRLQLGWSTIQSENPAVILTSISNFGQEGPYRDYRAWDIVAEAFSGLAYIFGYPEREPLSHPNAQAQYRAGVAAASATVAALLSFAGAGEHIDISIVECIAAALRDTIPQYTFMGAIRRRGSSPEGGPGAVTACSDGYVIPTSYGAPSWSTFARFLQSPELEDERFTTGEGRQEHQQLLAELLRRCLAHWQAYDFFLEAQAWGIGAGIVLTPKQVLSCEQLLARGFFQTGTAIDETPLPLPAGPFRL